MRLAHIIAMRRQPIEEIRETFCPVASAADRLLKLQRTWDTVFVFRTFMASKGDRHVASPD